MNNEHKHKFASIVLAAGAGTRMKSDLPKVMHRLAGKPMVAHVLASLKPNNPQKTVVVIAPQMEGVKEAALKEMKGCEFAIQEKQHGTGHAVKCAETVLKDFSGPVLILFGDTPLIGPATLHYLVHVAESHDVVVVGIELDNPTGYGRLLLDAHGQLKGIVECKDATPEQKQITLCNSGVMAVSGKHLFNLLGRIGADNAAGEYYLTDIIAEACEQGLNCAVMEADPAELAGINSRAQLADAEALIQIHLRRKALEEGATLIDPETVYLSTDTKIGRDVVIHPQVVFGEGVVVEDNVEIRSFSHIEGAHIKNNAIIGPFARLRPGSVIGEEAHVGNFVEIKKTTLGKGAKANHLSYVGDSEVGEGANIGAGTITCNYDGVNKHKTTIGAGAFIGSNTALVAPVTVGDNAIIGAGSVITKDVEKGALAIARAEQVNKPSKAAELKKTQKKA